MLHRSNAERQIWKANFVFRVIKRSDTGGEFEVVRLFMGKAVRPARVHREVRSANGCKGWPAGRAGEFATSVRSFDKRYCRPGLYSGLQQAAISARRGRG